MGENIERYIEGLKQEKAYAKAVGDDKQAKAVQTQIAAARKQLKKGSEQAEAAVAEPAETPEGT